MGIKLIHHPSSTTIELSKEPDLPLILGRGFNQDVVITDSGIRKIFTRKIKSQSFTMDLKILHHRDRKLLDQFFDETVRGQAELFDIELQIDHQEPLQVGSTQDGQPITVGTILEEDCGEPAGPIVVGQWVRQDRYIYPNCRLNQPQWIFADELPLNASTKLQLVQEIP